MMDTVPVISLMQRKLQQMGHYNGAIDGDRGPMTHAAVIAAIPQMPDAPQPGWQDWSDKRRSVAFLQLMCLEEGIDPGPVDGWWGPRTDFAVTSLLEKVETGAIRLWRDIVPSNDNPHGFPLDIPQGLAAFYGPHGAPDGSFRPPMVKVPSPWTFKLAWNMNQTRSFLWAHEKCAASLATVLRVVFDQYGLAEIERLRLNIFSGDYVPRLKKGGSTWSTHSWGIAYDFDDTNNKLEWGRDRAHFARPDYEPWWQIWEREGWVSLGRSRNFDWMHVQAARLP